MHKKGNKLGSTEPVAEQTLPPYAARTKDGYRLKVHVVPRASKTEIVGLHGDALRIRLQAPPVDGKANAALCAFIAQWLTLPTSAVSVVAGHTSRDKIIESQGGSMPSTL